MAFDFNKTLTIAYLNVHGQSGLSVSKQKQIEDFIHRNQIDILHTQEINIEEETFSQCNFILSNYNIIQNNALNKYGTASFVRSEFLPENLKMDTKGRAIIFDISGLTLGNIYLHSGTDALSRGGRENFCAETIPQLLVNCKEMGCLGGDLNCITRKEDCTHNPESKMSPSLKRLINTFSLVDSFRSLNPDTVCFSRYYSRGGSEEMGGSRIDRSYHWGNISVVESGYIGVAFSDHLAHVVKVLLPDTLSHSLSPRSRPFFKTSPEIVMDPEFKKRLQQEMVGWQEVLERGLAILPWWEIVVKPGIKRLAIARSKEMKKQKRSKLNCLMMKQCYFIKELQAGNRESFGQLKQVQADILEWYENESRKVVLQSRVEDVQLSEKVRIFHHEQHRKHVKRSSILKLQTADGLLEGHSACSDFLQNEVAKLLLSPASLDSSAQAALLAEVKPVFSEADNDKLKKLPSKDYVLEVLKQSNLNSAPGTDGITSLLYKEHWDILGDPLHQVITSIAEGEKLTASQRTSLMVFGSKPKKPLSIRPEDKRRISLLNADFKLATAIEANMFKQTFNHTLSPFQLVAGRDRRIHHGINKARDCINAVAKSKYGCALVDLDFIAAFDCTVLDWVFKVMRAKGVCEDVISRLSNIYSNCITIPVVNNVPGQPLYNLRGSLRQGCPGSMGWFSVAIDPLLLLLERKLQGIKICSLPALGPPEENQVRVPAVEERFTVYGLADDVKASVSCMAEFSLLEEAAKLFELSSGNLLHRDPVKGKCKVLPLGRWRNTLQQEDIGQPHFRLSDRLSMVGVELLASWQQTRKVNNDELLSRVKSTIGSWKSGKFMPLVSRPFSVNSYCISKIWFRNHSVDLRCGDITAISSACKSWIYQDMLEKPSELLLYRPVEEGGLGLHHVQSKAMASLISTFLQTAANPRFQPSLYHTLLYRRHCLLDETAPDIDIPPYYTKDFFNIIRDVVKNSPLNPIQMTVREWYRHLLEINVTMVKIDDEGRMKAKPCKVEEKEPELNWQLSFHLSRMKGLSPQVKSFNFKLLHQLLPCRERLSLLIPTTSSTCSLCTAQQTESLLHSFFECDRNRDAGQYLLQLTRIYDSSATKTSVTKLQITTEALYELPTLLVLCTGLDLIWRNRLEKKSTRLYDIRAELECLICALRNSRPRRLREASSMIKNTLENFPAN